MKGKKIPFWQISMVLLSVVIVVFFTLREKIKESLWPRKITSERIEDATQEKWIYRCPMDGYERTSPGICGICKMELNDTHKVKAGTAAIVEPTVTVTSDQVKAIGIKTEQVLKRQLEKEIRTIGSIEVDPMKTIAVTARVPGRIEDLFVSYWWAEVKKGGSLFTFYSPDLVTTQEEYLIALEAYEKVKETKHSDIVENAKKHLQSVKERLTLWGISEDQINELEKNKKAKTIMTITSPMDGIVTSATVERGKYVKEGDELYMISDISLLWLWVELYETEIGLVMPGQKVDIETVARPGDPFSGTIASRAIVIEKTRTSRALVYVDNKDKKLAPGMFATATIKIRIDEKGQPQIGDVDVEEKTLYDC